MFVWYSLLFIGFCLLAHSNSQEQKEISFNVDELTNQILDELKTNFGDKWEEEVSQLISKLEAIAKKAEEGELLGELGSDAEEMLRWKKWKKVLHKVGHVAGKAAGVVAGNIAGKVIAGAVGK